jgi:hypothetical protein
MTQRLLAFLLEAVKIMTRSKTLPIEAQLVNRYPSSTLMMEATGSSETSILIYKTTGQVWTVANDLTCLRKVVPASNLGRDTNRSDTRHFVVFLRLTVGPFPWSPDRHMPGGTVKNQGKHQDSKFAGWESNLTLSEYKYRLKSSVFWDINTV